MRVLRLNATQDPTVQAGVNVRGSMGGEPVHILGAGLSGLAAATYLAKAGREVHVYEIRSDSGARFDGDFQGIENWTSSESDFFDEMKDWGLDPDEFKSDDFDIIDLIHPDDEITNIADLSTLLGSLPRFDVVLLGMGEDAHTASLFPCAAGLREGLTTAQGALITRPRNAPHQRVSMSKRRLQATEQGVIHIVGEKKKAVLEQARKSEDEMRYPISAFLGPAGFDCWWAP